MLSNFAFDCNLRHYTEVLRNATVGTVERARMLLELLVSLRWVHDGAVPGADAPDPMSVKDGLNCYLALHHVFPQASNFVGVGVGGGGFEGGGALGVVGGGVGAGVEGGDGGGVGGGAGGGGGSGLASGDGEDATGSGGRGASLLGAGGFGGGGVDNVVIGGGGEGEAATPPRLGSAAVSVDFASLDFVGTLETMDTDWPRLFSTCGVQPAGAAPAYKELPHGGGHAYTSTEGGGEGGGGAQAAMHALLAQDAGALQAFCLLFGDDYRMGRYPQPEGCTG